MVETEPLLSRSDTTSSNTTDCSANNTCFGGGIGSNSLIIILGSCIPILIACVVLYFIHRAHIKRVRREEKNDKDFDMDFGVGELPGPVVGAHADEVVGSRDNQDPYLQGDVASMGDMGLQPPPGTLPYLVPKAKVSHESLYSLSDPRDDPYGAIYSSSRPPSPDGPYTPHSDQHSISGRSTRNLLAPIPQIDEQNSNLYKPMSRVPSPLAISEMPLPQRDLSPSKYLAPLNPEVADPLQMTSSPRSSTRSPLQDSTISHGEINERNPFPTPLKIPSPVPVGQGQLDLAQQKPPAVGDMDDRFPSPAHIDSSHVGTNSGSLNKFDSSYLHHDSEVEAKPGMSEDAGDDIADLYLEARNSQVQKADGFTDPLAHVDIEEDEDHAKRIQSVYKEYWNDSQYYDGNEEWGSLPHPSNRETQYPSTPPMPSNPNRPEWRDSMRASYDEQDWQYPGRLGDYYHHGKHDDTQTYRDPVGPGIDTQWHSPSGRPSFYSRPSTSLSTSSLPTRARTPTQSLEPLTDLPSVRYKLDDLTSPNAFSKPRRFAGSTGRASPINRPASPARVLSPSSRLTELPVPHRLRRSGSFSSINFAPVRKYGPVEMDAGDTGSIRSLARPEASLMATAGAGRIDRLPHDLVPVGKVGALASLRPQNYNGLHYV